MDDRLPAWVQYEPRPFPDSNLFLLPGPEPAMVDSGFVGHAGRTREWAEAHSGRRVATVVNTHWHSDHVGGNAALQASGAQIAASAPDADAVRRRDPGCCLAEYLDQPIAPYTVDRSLDDGDTLLLGETEWQVIRTPGHTPGHLCLWQPDEGLLAVGDALSDYDVGWVSTALDGPDAATVAKKSLERLDALHPRARRVFSYALMIRGGLPLDRVEDYLLARAWVADVAEQLGRPIPEVADELVASLRRSGAAVEHDGRLRAAADHTFVDPVSLAQPWPRDWPAGG